MAQAVQAGDVVGIMGDSKSIGSNGPEMLAPLKVAVSAYYQNRSAPPALIGNQVGISAPSWMTTFNAGSPRWWNLSAAGRNSNDLVSNLSTLYAIDDGRGPHWVVIAIETNDADPASGISNATWTANINTAVAGIRANCPRLRGNGIIWVQATCFGEIWPFGSNANDLTATGLGAKDDILRTRAAALNFEVAELRTDSTAVGGGAGPWLTYETANNAGKAASGVLTSDGRHDIAAGCTLVSSLVYAKLSLSG